MLKCSLPQSDSSVAFCGDAASLSVVLNLVIPVWTHLTTISYQKERRLSEIQSSLYPNVTLDKLYFAALANLILKQSYRVVLELAG